MRSLAFLPAAEHDLDDIWAYIAEDNPFAADRVTDAILAACRRLLDQPLMGVARPELADDLRMTVSGSYLLFYVPLTASRSSASCTDAETCTLTSSNPPGSPGSARPRPG